MIKLLTQAQAIISPYLTKFSQMEWSVTPSRFIIAATLVNLIVFNIPLFDYAGDHIEVLSLNGIQTLVTVFITVYLITAGFLYLVGLISVHLIKFFYGLFLIGNSICLYFITTYQVVITKAMIGNIFNTDSSEALELFHPKIILYVLVFAIIPLVIMAKIKLTGPTRLRLSAHFAITLLACSVWIYSAASSWLWIDKNGKNLGALILPWSYVINTARYQADLAKLSVVQELLPDGQFKGHQKTIVFLILGETARSKNFSLYGYNRDTNPMLKSLNTVALNHPTSCSTYTTASLKCILSHQKSSSVFGANYEPLPSYLHRHGIDVIWRTNNWGEPKVTTDEYIKASQLKRTCTGKGCRLDEVLLKGLSTRIKQSTKDKIFVVLHQKGSHGPSYNTRYTPEFEKFTPVCKSVELNKCTSDELINAYDNTILYTDYFIAKAINTIKDSNIKLSMLMYVSDHGESLGEFGLYLHGTPYSVAPDVQKNIPFLVWMSEDFKLINGVSNTSINTKPAHTHEDVFHSILGAFNMDSPVYNKSNDIFSH
jgi:lipid A ethanolaminephosphotransferase